MGPEDERQSSLSSLSSPARMHPSGSLLTDSLNNHPILKWVSEDTSILAATRKAGMMAPEAAGSTSLRGNGDHEHQHARRSGEPANLVGGTPGMGVPVGTKQNLAALQNLLPPEGAGPSPPGAGPAPVARMSPPSTATPPTSKGRDRYKTRIRSTIWDEDVKNVDLDKTHPHLMGTTSGGTAGGKVGGTVPRPLGKSPTKIAGDTPKPAGAGSSTAEEHRGVFQHSRAGCQSTAAVESAYREGEQSVDGGREDAGEKSFS